MDYSIRSRGAALGIDSPQDRAGVQRVSGMPRRLTNDLLLTLLLAQVLGGLLGWAWPTAFAAPLYDVHRALGVSVILLLGWKQAISIASLKRRIRGPKRWDRSILWGSIGAVALIATLVLGMTWTLNLISFDL